MVICVKKLFTIYLILIILLCGCRHTSQNQSDSSDETAPQQDFTNELSMIQDAQNYYFIENNVIYQQKKSDTDASQLYQHEMKEDSLNNLFVSNGYLYFFATNQTPYFEIFRINLKQRNVEKVTDYSEIIHNDDGEIFNSCVYLDGKIYIQMSFGFYYYDIESKTSEKLHDDVGEYHISNGALYFIDHAHRTFTIYKMDLGTKETEVVLGDGEWCEDKTKEKNLYKNFLFIGDAMFYYMRMPDGLYMYKDGINTLISDDSDIDESSLCEYQNELYFVKNNDQLYVLMKYNPSNQQIHEVATLDNYVGFNLIKNGRFYYKNTRGRFSCVDTTT